MPPAYLPPTTGPRSTHNSLPTFPPTAHAPPRGHLPRARFELSDGEFCWYSSRESAERGGDALGRVPLSMVLTARANGEAGYFEVDLGNRLMKLALHGVPRGKRDEFVSCWINALVNQQVM